MHFCPSCGCDGYVPEKKCPNCDFLEYSDDEESNEDDVMPSLETLRGYINYPLWV